MKKIRLIVESNLDETSKKTYDGSFTEDDVGFCLEYWEDDDTKVQMAFQKDELIVTRHSEWQTEAHFKARGQTDVRISIHEGSITIPVFTRGMIVTERSLEWIYQVMDQTAESVYYAVEWNFCDD